MKKLIINLLLVLVLTPTGFAQYISVPPGNATVISSSGVMVITTSGYDASYSSQFSPYHYFTGASLGEGFVENYGKMLKEQSRAFEKVKIGWAKKDSLAEVEFQEYRRKRELQSLEIIRRYMPEFKKEEKRDE